MAGNTGNRTTEQNFPAAASCGNTAVQGRGIFSTAESVDNQNIMQIPFIAPNIGIIAPEGDEIVAATAKNCLMPVGFRFAPTDAELIENYLMKKVNNKHLPPNDNIHETNLYETEPAQLTRRYPSGERTKWKMHEYKVKDGGIESGLKCQKFDSWVMCKIYVTRNRQGGTSQAVAGASSMTGNNNTVDATRLAIRFSSQNPDVSSSQQDYNGMSLMEATNDDKRAKKLAPQSSRGIRPTYVSHEHYSNASFSEMDTNGASSMPGSCKKRVGESSSMAENRNKMHASQNPLMPDAPSHRIWTVSSEQDVNGAYPMAGSDWQAINGAQSMAGNNDTMYPSAPASHNEAVRIKS
ncbi:hypothetical protein V6N13_117220 [Hibiscus sabdariffa]|uniref:NAC domain-containing protein n=1 Tax=Hibiscus sabdariffa TaxID=183260 RepID=A0ABR2P9Z8_9ROSI